MTAVANSRAQISFRRREAQSHARISSSSRPILRAVGCAPPRTRRAVRSVSSSSVLASRISSRVAAGSYAADSKAKATEDKAIFRAPIKFIKVVGYGPGGRRETAQPSEIKLYVEPEALNQEHNAQNHSNFGFGWHPMNLRVGHQENVSQFSGDVRRQHFSLFAQDKTEKHAWHTTLNTVTNSSREWAYVGHEIKDSCAYITGKKK